MTQEHDPHQDQETPGAPVRSTDTRSRTRPVRFAVVGLGHIAQIAVLPAFSHTDGRAELRAIVSGDSQKLREVGDLYNVPVRGGYDALEQCLEDCDAAYIATPNSSHADLTVRAAHAGVHVLCEKPLAVTEAECRRMIDSCREANVKLMAAYRLHFEPLMIKVLELIREGRIGDPKFFTSSFAMPVKPGNIRTRAALGGGTLYDLGVYCINAARMIFGAEPTRVGATSVSGARSGLPEVDEMTSAMLLFEGDRLATFTTSFAAASVSSLRIVGTDGDLMMQPAYSYREPLQYTLTSGGKTTSKKGRKRDQFAAELIYFSRCIRRNVQPEPSAEEGAWEVRIVEALYESAYRGEMVTLPPFGPEQGPHPQQAIDKPPVDKPELVNVDSPHD
jgi:predicted dehydrogenase